MKAKCYSIVAFVIFTFISTNASYATIDNDILTNLGREDKSDQSIFSNPSTNCKSTDTISNSCNINECLSIGDNSCNTTDSSNYISTATILVEKEEAGTGSMEPHHFEVNVDAKDASPDTFHPDPTRPIIVTLSPGEYSITERALNEIGPAYVISYSEDCEGTIQGGETKRCVITNTEDFADIKVIKEIEGDPETTPSIGNYTYSIINNDRLRYEDSQFQENTRSALVPGAYEVFETGDYSQHASYSMDCSGTISNGESKTCTITNTFE
ncbi:hypothetical protein BH23THE1_BH23THE1_18080 [soil metagenome]